MTYGKEIVKCEFSCCHDAAIYRRLKVTTISINQRTGKQYYDKDGGHLSYCSVCHCQCKTIEREVEAVVNKPIKDTKTGHLF